MLKKVSRLITIIGLLIMTLYMSSKTYRVTGLISDYINNTDYNYHGYPYLEIPKINLNNVLFRADDNFSNLDNGLVYYKELNPDNKIIIFGHSGMGMGVYFNNLDKLRVNDVAMLRVNEKTYSYVATRTYLVDETNVGLLDDELSSTKMLLVTCDKNDNKKRLVVEFRLRCSF